MGCLRRHFGDSLESRGQVRAVCGLGSLWPAWAAAASLSLSAVWENVKRASHTQEPTLRDLSLTFVVGTNARRCLSVRVVSAVAVDSGVRVNAHWPALAREWNVASRKGFSNSLTAGRSIWERRGDRTLLFKLLSLL